MKHLLSDLGEIKIHKALISQIVEASTLTVEGVSALSITHNKWLAQIFALLKIRTIKVDVSKDLKIEVPIIVRMLPLEFISL